ncbi:MAG: isochorismatase family protein, partial [Bacteroidota bacterium]|nr:isochorismatase family protein [Bacteroidota bacterium]
MDTNLTGGDFAHCALITIDLQNDTLPGQPMEVPGTKEIIPQVSALLAAFRIKKLPVVHLVRIYRPDGKNVDLCRRQQVLNGKQLFIAGTHGAELIPQLLNEELSLDTSMLLNGAAQYINPHEII